MNVDNETVELILRLQIVDLEEREVKIQGKVRFGAPLTDEHVALRVHASELQAALALLEDAQIAQSMNKAAQCDAEILRLFEEREAMEKSDREMALRASNRVPRPADNILSPIRPISPVPFRVVTPTIRKEPAPLLPSKAVSRS
ncbi:hypothetical protein FRC14_008106 [Serendipita sp. 396]|nr:hypothetical protein FRC14_008106 [Serendipita sp. 396]KAG8787075.1 hypothetical protein FRC15_010015 [Serendipita sp. 397]KAG8828757.1 hypothetical protein FRC19_000145 [Serendipita sp. 401]KAG8835994.1 hypothetical protein FRC18_012074 [Serendipita sp. 400]KAG8870787.1 hypothetical protein FRC20_011334 [Serendipita sp. 405]KAG9057352.1 hypothetical protein FS842_007265 [Serendipita sp. 407]